MHVYVGNHYQKHVQSFGLRAAIWAAEMKMLSVKLLLGAVLYILLVESAEVSLLSGVHLKLPAFHVTTIQIY